MRGATLGKRGNWMILAVAKEDGSGSEELFPCSVRTGKAGAYLLRRQEEAR